MIKRCVGQCEKLIHRTWSPRRQQKLCRLRKHTHLDSDPGLARLPGGLPGSEAVPPFSPLYSGGSTHPEGRLDD